jgi:hypothetical protein
MDSSCHKCDCRGRYTYIAFLEAVGVFVEAVRECLRGCVRVSAESLKCSQRP